jgi:hypothetical protein
VKNSVSFTQSEFGRPGRQGSLGWPKVDSTGAEPSVPGAHGGL